MRAWLESRFKLSENGTTVRRELLGGTTTFMTMSYIIFIQPAVLSTVGMDKGAVMVATCIAAAVGTLLMGLLAKYPIAQAPAMGHNIFFAVIVCGTMGYTWQVALGANFISGTLFLVLALAGVLLLRGAAETGILAFLPILVEQKGGTLITAGATLSVFKLSGAVGAIVAGFLSDRWTGKPLMLVSFLLSVVFLYGFVQVDGTVALILIALLGGALLSSSAYTMVVAQDLLPGRHSTAAGLFWSISLLGGGLGALVEGFLADGFGVETALLLLGVPLPLAAAALTLGIRDRFPAG